MATPLNDAQVLQNLIMHHLREANHLSHKLGGMLTYGHFTPDRCQSMETLGNRLVWHVDALKQILNLKGLHRLLVPVPESDPTWMLRLHEMHRVLQEAGLLPPGPYPAFPAS